MTQSLMDQLVCSPCCAPKLSFDELLPPYRQLGFRKYEGFSEWAEARFDWRQPAAPVAKKAHDAGMEITSFHLPLIKAEAVEEGFQNAVAAARFARDLGVKVILLKASNRDVFGLIGRRFLDTVEQEQLGLTTVVQNHKGTAITTLEDYAEVFAKVDHDPRLKGLLEVGHFQRVGVPWQTGWDFLGDRIGLIHINEIRDGASVHFGTGEVDFAGLLQRVKETNYKGEIVVELELPTRETDPQATYDGLRGALDLLLSLYSKAN